MSKVTNKFIQFVVLEKKIRKLFRNYLQGNVLIPSERIPFTMDMKQGKSGDLSSLHEVPLLA